MEKTENKRKFDLEDRTLVFAREIRGLAKVLPKSISNLEDKRQLIRSSGSIGANYIEANESLSKKDFLMRIKISRKEAKETIYWLRLLDVGEDKELQKKIEIYKKEATELMKIFGAILEKSK